MENVSSRAKFSNKIKNKNGPEEAFLFLIENLAIIISAEIHRVKKINGRLKKSVENLLLKIVWYIWGGSPCII